MSCPDAVNTAACQYLEVTGHSPTCVRLGLQAFQKYVGCLLDMVQRYNPENAPSPADARVFQMTNTGRVEVVLDPTLDPDEVLACMAPSEPHRNERKLFNAPSARMFPDTHEPFT